jgi:phage terminase small subunit
MALTGKQKLFVEHYAATMNATKAARRAGYAEGESNLSSAGSRLLINVKVKAELDKRFAKMTMGADECLARLAEHAKSESGQALRALELIGKAHSLFTDKIEHSGHIDYTSMSDEKLKELAGRG